MTESMRNFEAEMEKASDKLCQNPVVETFKPTKRFKNERFNRIPTRARPPAQLANTNFTYTW